MSSHHFRGIGHYADQLMDFAEGRPVFKGRGKKPSNKTVLDAIASIEKCQEAHQRSSFFQPKELQCTCGWHTKAAARKQSRQQQTQTAASSSTPTTLPVTSASEPARSMPVSSSLQAMSVASTSTATTTTASSDMPGPGPVPPKFDKSDFQSLTIQQLRTIEIGSKTSPGLLDMIVYCPLKGRCPHCQSTLINANSVGKPKLCYAVPWPKTVVGVDMKCTNCKKHFMTHDPLYIKSLPSEQQVKQDFVGGKGNATHMSLIRLLRSGSTVSQLERYIEDTVREHYLRLKSEYQELWDKVCSYLSRTCHGIQFKFICFL